MPKVKFIITTAELELTAEEIKVLKENPDFIVATARAQCVPMGVTIEKPCKAPKN